MSSRTGDELHWQATRGNAILRPPPQNERRQELSHVDQPIRSLIGSLNLAQVALASFGLAPASGMALHWAVLGGFTLLMLAAAWITFLRSEANT